MAVKSLKHARHVISASFATKATGLIRALSRESRPLEELSREPELKCTPDGGWNSFVGFAALQTTTCPCLDTLNSARCLTVSELSQINDHYTIRINHVPEYTDTMPLDIRTACNAKNRVHKLVVLGWNETVRYQQASAKVLAFEINGAHRYYDRTHELNSCFKRLFSQYLV